MGLIAKDNLFGEIWVNFQLLQNPISGHTALSMVVYLKFLGQLNFIGMHTQVDAKFAKFLWTTRNRPPRVFPYTLTHSSDVFSRPCVSTYWCWLIIYRIGWLDLVTKRRIVDSAGRLWRNHIMRGMDFSNRALILIIKFYDLHTLLNYDLPWWFAIHY